MKAQAGGDIGVEITTVTSWAAFRSTAAEKMATAAAARRSTERDIQEPPSEMRFYRDGGTGGSACPAILSPLLWERPKQQPADARGARGAGRQTCHAGSLAGVY